MNSNNARRRLTDFSNFIRDNFEPNPSNPIMSDRPVTREYERMNRQARRGRSQSRNGATRTSSNASSTTDRRTRNELNNNNNNNPDNNAANNNNDPLVQPINPQYPTTPSAQLLSPDAILRNIAFVSVLFALILLFLNVALYISLISVAICVPAWRTFKSLESPYTNNATIIEIDDDLYDVPMVDNNIQNDDLQLQNNYQQLRNWHKYWILSCFIFILHIFVFNPFVLSFLPVSLYRAFLISIFTYLNCNQANNAANVYDAFVKPTLSRSEHSIDVAIESIARHADSFTRQFIVTFNQAVEPYARQLGHAADASRRQIEEQQRRTNLQTNYFDD